MCSRRISHNELTIKTKYVSPNKNVQCFDNDHIEFFFS